MATVAVAPAYLNVATFCLPFGAILTAGTDFFVGSCSNLPLFDIQNENNGVSYYHCWNGSV